MNWYWTLFAVLCLFAFSAKLYRVAMVSWSNSNHLFTFASVVESAGVAGAAGIGEGDGTTVCPTAVKNVPNRSAAAAAILSSLRPIPSVLRNRGVKHKLSATLTCHS